MKWKVLVVEDDRAFADQIIRELQSKSFETEYAEDGYEALTILASKKFDLIISDTNMPRVDGFDLISRVRKDDEQTPIWLYTAGNSYAGLSDFALALKANKFIPNVCLQDITNYIVEFYDSAVARNTGLTNKFLGS